MKRNFDAPLIRLDGQPFRDGDGDAASPMTLKLLSFGVVSVQTKGDENMDVDGKLRLYKLAAKVVNGGVIDLSAEDMALLKDRIAKCCPPLVVGAAFDLLEQDYVEPDRP